MLTDSPLARSYALPATFEPPAVARSDRPIWIAAGAERGTPGFATVAIAPTMGPLQRMSGSMVHPMGRIDVDLSVAGAVLTGKIMLLPRVRDTDR